MTHQSEQVLVRRVTLTVFLGGVDSVKQSNAVASAFRQKYPCLNMTGKLSGPFGSNYCADSSALRIWTRQFSYLTKLFRPHLTEWERMSEMKLSRPPVRAVIEVWTWASLWMSVWVLRPPEWLILHSKCAFVLCDLSLGACSSHFCAVRRTVKIKRYLLVNRLLT